MTICFGRRPPYADKDEEIAETYDAVRMAYPERYEAASLASVARLCKVSDAEVRAALARVHTERKR